MTPLLRRAAADLEGFAHSAAAGPESAHEAQNRHLPHSKFRVEARLADFGLNSRLAVDILKEYRKRVDENKVFLLIINDFAYFHRLEFVFC